MTHQRLKLAGITTLLRCLGEPKVAARENGTVLIYHALGGEKEDMLELAETCAQAGFVALVVDAYAHGARRDEVFEQRLMGTEDDEKMALWQCVAASAGEVPQLLDALTDLYEGYLGGVGVLGYSMGGAIALAAAARDPRITALVCINGSPLWAFTDAELLLQLAPVAMLLLGAAHDTIVKATEYAWLIEKLRPHYGGQSDRLCYTSYPNAEHILDAASWRLVQTHSVRFLRQFVTQP